jgi:hypothetical protein
MTKEELVGLYHTLMYEFLKRPTHKEWQRELDLGWRGSDGSSSSTDTIMGVRIGITSDSYEYVDLPGNRHDFYYRLGRRLRLSGEFRKAADKVYRDLCISTCLEELAWYRPFFWIAFWRAWGRYIGLRVGARFAWTQKAKVGATKWDNDQYDAFITACDE